MISFLSLVKRSDFAKYINGVSCTSFKKKSLGGKKSASEIYGCQENRHISTTRSHNDFASGVSRLKKLLGRTGELVSFPLSNIGHRVKKCIHILAQGTYSRQ